MGVGGDMKNFLAAALLLVFVFFTNAFAQTTNATLGGTVIDPSRALIPGVTVTATNTQTGIVTTVVTNETGAYQFASLQTGVYKVTAELPGFQTQAYNDVTLGVGQQVRLNFTLQVGAQAQSVEVSVAADTLIATTSSSVGAVLPEYKVRDLPLATRNVLDLVNTTPGVQGSNFAGTRLTQLNTTRDGIPVSDGRYDIGAATSTYTSPDLVDEVRVIVAPADAELGRGVGQIQMSTRSGTNQFRGSLFLVNRNSALSANSWSNNFNGVGKNYYNGNQFGGRIGGPIIKNKTFFFFLFDGQRFVTKNYFTGTVLTDQARRGLFRFFPGVQNGNAGSNNPVVDRAGNPVSPVLNGQPVPVSSLQAINVFNYDQLRTQVDPTGYINRLIGKMPLPNDFNTGDGLNTAGYRWLRRNEGVDVANGDGQDTDRNQYNMRIDHNFNSAHKASFSGTWERDWAETTQAGMSNWPGGYNGSVRRKPRVFIGSVVSTLSPTIVNEFRFGSRKNWNYSWSSIWRPDEVGDAARKELPTRGGTAFWPVQSLFPDHIITSVSGAATRGQTSPLWNFSDNLSWTKGKHAFKGGYEIRLTSSRGWNGTDNKDWYQFATVSVGAGNNPVTGISQIPGLLSAPTAQNLLLDLSGSVSNVALAFNVLQPTDESFAGQVRIKEYHENEWSTFFKDDWKLRPDLTLNLGVRYDWYGVPWEKNGMHALPVGAMKGLYGISGGSQTVLQLVGKNSNHPDTLFYPNDWNNFAPAVGLSWSLPWGGKDKTVLRAGYGMSYQGAASFNAGLNIASGNNPGLSFNQNFTTLAQQNPAGLFNTKYFNFASSDLPIPVPSPTGIKPLTPQGFYVRTDPLVGFDDNRVNPYTQNFNLEIQREIAKNLTFEARYIGTKGTKLFGGLSLNDMNIYAQADGQTLLDAFNVTRRGGNAPLFDRLLKGITLNAGTNAALGQGVVDGVNVTGSAALRTNATFRTFLANGNVGQFANALNTSAQGTTLAGGLIRNGGLPDNWLVVNPQYAAVVMQSNPGSSTYHSMNLQVTKRLSQGFTTAFAYTWSRGLGESGGDGNLSYLDSNNHRLNKTLLGFHRTHDIRMNGTLELPFGPNRRFLSSSPGIIARIIERWQLGGIMGWSSGSPLTITAANSELSWTQVPGQIAIARTSNTPNILANFGKDTGIITPVRNGANYFADFTQGDDPFKNQVTNSQTLQTAFTNKVILDKNGNIVLASPNPGNVGSLGRQWIEGPGHIKLDVNLVKRIRVDEVKNFEIRMDVIDILNTPYWNNPTVDINSLNFGRMDASDVTTGVSNADNRSSNRKFTFTARFNF
jgi:Carboxypeptidase regulatory-like domain